MKTTRRQMLQLAGGGALIYALPSTVNALGTGRSKSSPGDSSKLQSLLKRSIDAAVAAGADYTDARATHTFELSVRGYPIPSERIAVGTRSLVNGYWGFAASSLLTDSEATRLGVDSVGQARANGLNQVRDVDLASFQGPALRGQWHAQVEDPWSIYPYEFQDFQRALYDYIGQLRYTSNRILSMRFRKQVNHFVASTGSLLVQTTYLTSGTINFIVQRNNNGPRLSVSLDCLSPSGLGYEYFRDQDLRQKIREAYEEALIDLSIPTKPVEVGRFPVLINAMGVAGLVGGTIGCATELDRIMGDDANTVGTSYIDSPSDMLGSFRMGSDLLNVDCQRTEDGGAASVRWDDEGVPPRDISLVTDGVLTGVQTTRESSAWIAGRNDESTGSAIASSAESVPLVFPGNLNMKAADDRSTFDSMIADMESGIVFKNAGFGLDFQLNSGTITGRAYEIKNGKRVSHLVNTGVLFRAPELWSSMDRIGGATSLRRLGMSVSKGEPEQSSHFSVTAPPAVFADTTVIDITRK